MIFKENKPKYKPKKHSFLEILDHEYIRDYSDYLYLYLKSPYDNIACFLLGLIRFILILITIIIAIGIMILSVFGIISLIIIGGVYAVIGLTIALIAINTVNYFATYKDHSRKIWYFWICLFGSLFAYFSAIVILLR